MNITKKILFVLATSIIASLAFAQVPQEKVKSTYSMFFSHLFFSPQDIIDAYKGAWSGTQLLTVGGREIATALVEQNYIPSGANQSRLVGSGKITGMGTSIPTRSFMYVENGNLCLDIRTQDNRNVQYIGFFSMNKIDWVPRYFFMTYDMQTDIFSETIDGTKLESCEIKYVKIESNGFEGYIQVDCTLRKSESIYRKEKVNTSRNAKFVFPNAKMGD